MLCINVFYSTDSRLIFLSHYVNVHYTLYVSDSIPTDGQAYSQINIAKQIVLIHLLIIKIVV